MGARGLQKHVQITNWRGLWSRIQPFHHPPTQPLVVTRGLFQVWFSICVYCSVLIKCSWKHDYAGGMQASKTLGSCLLGTQDLRVPEVSCFYNRYHLSHGASPYLSPDIDKLSPRKREIRDIIAS